MAHYDITYTCGHTDCVNLIGPHRSRAARIDRMESGPCFACYKTQQHQVAVVQAKEMDLPPFTDGSPAQQQWAESLRVEILDRLETYLADSEAHLPANHVPTEDEIQVLHLVAIITAETSAKQWIAWRLDQPVDIIRQVKRRERAKPSVAKTEVARSAKAQATADATLVLAAATVQPENPVTATVAEIRIVGSAVTITFPEKRDDFRAIVKSMGYTWNETHWKRFLGPFNGTPRDRAAEAGHTLLSKRFCIRILDDALRAAAITGDYAPECTRWVRAVVSGEYAGWFSIVWSRDEDYYTAARKITGSRYDKPRVVVPPEQFEQVLDFAQRYGFQVSDGAQTILDTARAARAQMLVVQPPARKKAPAAPPVSDTPPVLAVPESVDIAASLKDND